MPKHNAKSVEEGAKAAIADQTTPHTERVAFSVDDVADASDLGRTSIFEEIRNGRLKARKVGRRTIILKEDRDAWLASLPCR